MAASPRIRHHAALLDLIEKKEVCWRLGWLSWLVQVRQLWLRSTLLRISCNCGVETEKETGPTGNRGPTGANGGLSMSCSFLFLYPFLSFKVCLPFLALCLCMSLSFYFRWVGRRVRGLVVAFMGTEQWIALKTLHELIEVALPISPIAITA